MPTIIRSMNDLTKIIESRFIKALEMTRDEIFDVISRKVSEYYQESVFSSPDEREPDFYNRTGRLMDSLTASHIKKNANCYEFTVGWDDDYLIFRYSSGFVKSGYDSKYNGITGLQVLKAFNSGSHGYTVHGDHNYWDEAIDELGGQHGILNKFKKNLKTCDIPIK